ncbi:MAG: Polyphosphate kinase 2 [uncultured Propionibacteriaceae bacterium]|uniref:Polyphosphate kinase 2 n=1 Tax=uncultured Propionibacteriaceae bacterium TaxID=257457 RepID=A0A6J4N758_9ACTN|nr:MAG: Polyphosphate kinase 2 [uncultured Propionibacteriaceae bacterium]
MARKTKDKKSKLTDAVQDETPPAAPLTELLRLPAGPVQLADFDARSTPGFVGSKGEARTVTRALAPELNELQERLFAAGRVGHPDAKRILVILQGMDTAGKGGVIRHAIGMVDPQGVKIKAFAAPTKAELRHHFLWRIRRELPAPGMIGIFDRSQYEDVLTVRVNHLVEESIFSTRYDEIIEWEASLVASGVTVVKCFLHISSEKQKERLAERLAEPTKHWKYDPHDLIQRAKWADYTEAYQTALERCNSRQAPWYLIPSDRKWYRNWAVAQLLIEHLRQLDLQWPAADFDVEEQRRLLAAS